MTVAIPVIRRHRIALESPEHRHFERFVEPPREPRRTVDLVPPDVVFHQELITTMDLELPYRLPDGSRKLRMWVISDPTSTARPRFPSPLLRVREGQVVHADVITGGGSHTVHWHGIEPSPLNDGVGKHSFDVKDHYVYQWRASEAGFYFYHCHRNTPLHFEMGLFGPLIVDPARGEGWVAAHDPANDHLVRYDREAVWVCTAHDSRWRRLSNGHALMHDTDPNDRSSFTSSGVLHDWRPDVFTISGAPANGTRAITDPRAAVRTRVGETLLLRVLNAAYATARVTV
ncbi:MAG TPA: multicopper oxidase domain-containing protein, partial [Miltoncostaeaceae bacterium]|nr:multicopper oxidase domain-containing protein [Miltoncostaeaceae bacterium]